MTKFKARLVARGDMQRAYIDFGEKFAPTVAPSSVRLLAALACEQNLELRHFDIEQAFVQSDLDEDVFMQLPDGCSKLSGKVVKLNKSLYGLKQASRQWHTELTKCLLLLGFEQCSADACVFRLIEDGKIVMMLVVHVDDIFAVGEKERCDKFGRDLNEMVPVKNLGELRWYSGCFYERDFDRGVLKISQQTYAEELAGEYGVEWGKDVPLPVETKLTEYDENEESVSFRFRELVGSLMWLSTQTRPDISNAVRAVARYCASPKQVHWRAALGILGYIRRTSWMGITFQRNVVGGLSMQVFADADYASKATDRRSVSGGIIMCGGSCVSWFSRTQKCVTLSTTEAEYVAMAEVLKEALFLRQVWRFMLPKAGMPCIPLFEDNEGAIQIARNPVTNSNSKHIDVRYHFIRDLVARKEISISHVSSELQHADFLTKAISKKSFEDHRNFVMNISG